MHLTENSKNCVYSFQITDYFIAERKHANRILYNQLEFSHVLRGCVKVHARQLIGECSSCKPHTGVAQILSDIPGYAVVSRDFCKVYSYHDALPNHQLGRSRSPQMPYIHLIYSTLSFLLAIIGLHLSFPLSQINCDAVAKATDRLIIPECQLSIKWVGGGSGNEDLLPSDLHCNVSFTGSHQKRNESFVHLHVRCNQGNQQHNVALYCSS